MLTTKVKMLQASVCGSGGGGPSRRENVQEPGISRVQVSASPSHSGLESTVNASATEAQSTTHRRRESRRMRLIRPAEKVTVMAMWQQGSGWVSDDPSQDVITESAIPDPLNRQPR